MKKWNRLFIVLALVTIMLAACGGNDATNDATDVNNETAETEELAYTPEDIADTDVCEVCAMAVPQDQHATQIILTNERSLKFDDLGCLFEWKRENGEEDIGAEFVRDFKTEDWIQVKDATFVYDSEIMTPMAYGIISFADETDAKSFIEEEGKGEILTAEDLNNHHFERNMDMMQHHGHGEHDHDEHEADQK